MKIAVNMNQDSNTSTGDRGFGTSAEEIPIKFGNGNQRWWESEWFQLWERTARDG